MSTLLGLDVSRKKIVDCGLITKQMSFRIVDEDATSLSGTDDEDVAGDLGFCDVVFGGKTEEDEIDDKDDEDNNTEGCLIFGLT